MEIDMKFTYAKGLLILTSVLLAFALNVHSQQLEEPYKSTQAADTSKQQMETPESKDIPGFRVVSVC
jgi:hypothetical protein